MRRQFYNSGLSIFVNSLLPAERLSKLIVMGKPSSICFQFKIDIQVPGTVIFPIIPHKRLRSNKLKFIRIDAQNQFHYNLFIIRKILTLNLKPDTNSNTYLKQN